MIIRFSLLCLSMDCEHSKEEMTRADLSADYYQVAETFCESKRVDQVDKHDHSQALELL